MAMALHGELRGFRHIEQMSGITDDSILNVVPEAGGSTLLLSCSNRGKFSYDETEREHIRLTLRPYRTPAGHPEPKNLTSSNTVQEIRLFSSVSPFSPLSTEESKYLGVRRETGIQKEALDLLDPSLDIWTNATKGSDERQEFGDAGWMLAVATQMRETVLALAEIGRITQLGERQVRRVVDKLVKWGWAQRIKEGRRVLVRLTFHLMAHEDFREDYLKHQRRSRKIRDAQGEKKSVGRLATKLGREVLYMWRSRKSVIEMFGDWAEMVGSCAHWDRLTAILKRGMPQEDGSRGLGRWWAQDALTEELKPYYPVEEW